jgi:glycosyltransferase involved in cell wall biosynthesis
MLISEKHVLHDQEETPPLLLHICYGGLGGHNAVVVGLSEEHRAIGYRSEAVLLARKEEMTAGNQYWPHLDKLWPVTISRRGDISSMLRVYQIVRQCRPAVVICHTHRQMISVWLATFRRREKPKLVLAEHQPLSLRSKSDDVWSFIGIFLSKIVVVLTPEYAASYRWRTLAERRKRPIIVIPNGIRVNSKFEDHRIRIVDEVMIIGMASRLSHNKDLPTLVRAIRTLADGDVVKPKLLLAGDGPLRDELESLVALLGLTAQVDFLGRLEGKQLEDFYRTVDVYVQATCAETLSMSVLQAASAGLPIVASDVEGINNVFGTSEMISLYSPGDSHDLASKIELLRDPEVAAKMGQRARKHVQMYYDIEITAVEYIRTLKSLF